MTKCFACDRKLGSNPHHVDTRDDQWVMVGSECYKKIKAAGEEGYKHPDCMRLWRIPKEAWMAQGPRIIHAGSNV